MDLRLRSTQAMPNVNFFAAILFAIIYGICTYIVTDNRLDDSSKETDKIIGQSEQLRRQTEQIMRQSEESTRRLLRDLQP